MSLVDAPAYKFEVEANALLDEATGSMSYTVQCEVVDYQLNHLGTCVPLAAADITATKNGKIHRQLGGLILDSADMGGINPDTDAIRVWAVMGDGHRWPCGVFVFDVETEHLGLGRSYLSYSNPDLDKLLNLPSDWPYGLAPNASLVVAIHEILDECGISPLHRSIPAAPTEVVADPPNFVAGTDKHEMLDKLCTLGGWLPGYFANDGTYTVKPPPNPYNTNPDHLYLPQRMDVTGYVRERQLWAPNFYVVIGTGPTKGEIVGTAFVDADLPFSFEKRGIKVPSVSRVQSVSSTEAANQMARTNAASATAGQRSLTFTGPMDPRHDLCQTMLTLTDGIIYTETAFTLNLNGNPMKHSGIEGGFRG